MVEFLRKKIAKWRAIHNNPSRVKIFSNACLIIEKIGKVKLIFFKKKMFIIQTDFILQTTVCFSFISPTLYSHFICFDESTSQIVAKWSAVNADIIVYRVSGWEKMEHPSSCNLILEN